MLGSPLVRVCSLRSSSSSSKYAPWELDDEEDDDEDAAEGGMGGVGGGGGGGGLGAGMATGNDHYYEEEEHSKLNQLIGVYVALSVLVLMVIKFLSRYSLLGLFLTSKYTQSFLSGHSC